MSKNEKGRFEDVLKIRKSDAVLRRKMRILKQSHSANNLKGGFLTFFLLQKIEKIEGGPFDDIKKFTEKISQ